MLIISGAPEPGSIHSMVRWWMNTNSCSNLHRVTNRSSAVISGRACYLMCPLLQKVHKHKPEIYLPFLFLPGPDFWTVMDMLQGFLMLSGLVPSWKVRGEGLWFPFFNSTPFFPDDVWSQTDDEPYLTCCAGTELVPGTQPMWQC